jgi:hypothetical protein
MRITAEPIPARGSGADYTFVDAQGGSGDVYWLEEIDLSGQRQIHGPVQVAAPAQVSLVQQSGGVALAPVPASVEPQPAMPAQPAGLAQRVVAGGAEALPMAELIAPQPQAPETTAALAGVFKPLESASRELASDEAVNASGPPVANERATHDARPAEPRTPPDVRTATRAAVQAVVRAPVTVLRGGREVAPHAAPSAAQVRPTQAGSAVGEQAPGALAATAAAIAAVMAAASAAVGVFILRKRRMRRQGQ